MRILPLVVVLQSAAPVCAQSPLYTNADLTPKPVTAWTRRVTAAELESLRQYQYRAPPAPAREPWPSVFVMASSPTAGPYGEFEPFPETRPLNGTPYVVSPRYVGRSYRARPDGDRGRSPDRSDHTFASRADRTRRR
jgi:hypothetical protein